MMLKNIYKIMGIRSNAVADFIIPSRSAPADR